MAKKKIERIAPDGSVIPMTDEELDALDAKRRRVILVGAFSPVIAIGAALLASNFLKLNLAEPGPFEKNTLFSNKFPGQVRPAALEKRLDEQGDTSWGLGWWGYAFDGGAGTDLATGWAATAASIERPVDSKVFAVEDITTIYTNVVDPASVAANGHLMIYRMARPSAARDFVLSEPDVFSDPGVERQRDLYVSGTLVYAYSPVGGAKDRTRPLRAAMPAVASCGATLVASCPVSPEFSEFDDWAPRAPLADE